MAEPGAMGLCIGCLGVFFPYTLLSSSCAVPFFLLLLRRVLYAWHLLLPTILGRHARWHLAMLMRRGAEA